MWGRLGDNLSAENIYDLRAAIAQVRDISKEHTVYRSVVSLDEDTALLKGYTGREQWQQLVCNHVNTIGKENEIDLKDLRWCATYHHERGHPHAHIVFWDNGDKVRNEFMSEERFEIAAEKIRASFNGEIFKEELRGLRKEQDEAKKQLRANSRNFVEGYGNLTFFQKDEPEEFIGVNFYPKGLKVEQAQELCHRLEELAYLLPENGQLKYQYLARNVRHAVDLVSACLLEQTTLKQIRDDIIRTAVEISETYGNTPEATERQSRLMEKKLIKDIGNDILSALAKDEWLERREQTRMDALAEKAYQRAFSLADNVLHEKMRDPLFYEKFLSFANEIGSVYTPKHIVLGSPEVSASLRSLTLECMNDERLRSELRISQAFSERQAETIKQDSERQVKPAKENAEWKAVYRHISNYLYDEAASSRGWDTQRQQMSAVSFLMAFCRIASGNERLRGFSGRYLFKRELSKQAKKERYLTGKDTNAMWEGETWY